MAEFIRRPMEDNTWNPNICGVDMRERLAQKIGEWAGQLEMYTVWITIPDDDTGPGYTEQVHQDNCRVFISELDDDSDTISYLDKRDNQWFYWTRARQGELFDAIAQAVMPWSVFCHSLAPQEQIYQKLLDDISSDFTEDFHIPDDWQT